MQEAARFLFIGLAAVFGLCLVYEGWRYLLGKIRREQ